MGQRANFLSQRLNITLLWKHKTSLVYFKKFFWFKLLLDFIVINFLKKYNLGLVNFNLSFSTSKLILDVFTYNYSTQFFKITKKSSELSRFCSFNNFYWKVPSIAPFVLNCRYFEDVDFLSSLSPSEFSLKELEKMFLEINLEPFVSFFLFFFNTSGTKLKKLNFFFKLSFFSNFLLFFQLFQTRLNIKKTKYLIQFFIVNYVSKLKFLKLPLNKKILKNHKSLSGLSTVFKRPFYFYLKTPSYKFCKKKIIRFLLQLYLKKLFKKSFLLNIYNSNNLLNKFNKAEINLNIVTLILKRRNIFIHYSDHSFFKTFIKVLIISLRFKQIGLFSDLISTRLVKVQRNQWRFIRLLRKLLYYLRIDTVFFLGIHILLSGKFQKRRRKKRVHILKWRKPSAQVFDLNLFYSYRQSISIYGVLGVKIWFYY